MCLQKQAAERPSDECEQAAKHSQDHRLTATRPMSLTKKETEMKYQEFRNENSQDVLSLTTGV